MFDFIQYLLLQTLMNVPAPPVRMVDHVLMTYRPTGAHVLVVLWGPTARHVSSLYGPFPYVSYRQNVHIININYN